jgi:hypothetical protein
MDKRGIKIVILFVLIIAIIVVIRQLYNILEYNKQYSLTEIYDYASPQATSIINISREYNFEELYTFDSTLKGLIDILGDELPFPTMIARFSDNEKILITKVRRDQESEIKINIIENISYGYPAKERNYKNAKLLFYNLSDTSFLVCTFYKGIFAISENYRRIREFVDSDPDNTFFSNEKDKEFITKIRNNAPVCLFIKSNDNSLLALEYHDKAQDKSIELAGYVLTDNEMDSINCVLTPYLIQLPDSICIDDINVSVENKPAMIKILLRKTTDTVFNTIKY